MTTHDYTDRRRRILEAMGDAVAVFPSAPPRIRSNDSEYEYRQDSDFYYLTGFDEPESVLVLSPRHPSVRSALFVRPRDSEREQWEGRRAGVEGARLATGVDATYPIVELQERLGEFLETAPRLYYSFANEYHFNEMIENFVRRYRTRRTRQDGGPLEVVDPCLLVHEMRLIKSAAEVATLRAAVAITGAAHVAAMRQARPGMYEYEVAAIVEYECARRGAQAQAYPSIVASGANLTTIHYRTNRDLIPDGSLVLVDAGAELDYYCADITRTWPIRGRFSAEQRAIYEIVLAANRAAIDLCRPGRVFNTEINDASTRILVEGLLDLGLLTGSLDEQLEKETHKRFTQHRVGHWLGLDTHDVGSYRRNGTWRPLEPGMVVTIEPGLYVGDQPDIPERFRNIAVRIEDDVLVTADAPDVLSADIPKDAADIERIMAEGRSAARELIA
jgi:Xaa-Pro aminopeptidase